MSLFEPSLIQATNNSGNPSSGAKWKFYLTGTSTPTNVFSNATLATSLGTTVTADSSGWFVPIYVDDSVAYRAVMTNAAGTTIGGHDIDPVNVSTSTGLAVTRGGATGDTGGVRTSVAVGSTALDSNTFVLNGYAAGGGIYYNQGDWNIAIGDGALANNTTGHRNVALGQQALENVTTGKYNFGLGVWAGKALTTGDENIFIGTQSGQYAQTGSNNIGVGTGTLLQLTSGYENTAVGDHSGANVTTGYYNSFIGRQAGLNVTTGHDNAIFGYQAGSAITTASYNTVFGSAALGACVTGTENAIFGRRSFVSATGSYNTGLGSDSGVSVTTGAQNTFIGYNAGSNVTTGSNVSCFGYGATASAVGVSDEMTFGNANLTKIRAPGIGFVVSLTDFNLPKTSTAVATVGAQTISKPAGSVNFAAAATSLVVTNALVTATSVIIATVGTNDTTMKSVAAVAGAGSFTLYANAAATAETRVSFMVVN